MEYDMVRCEYINGGELDEIGRQSHQKMRTEDGNKGWAELRTMLCRVNVTILSIKGCG